MHPQYSDVGLVRPDGVVHGKTNWWETFSNRSMQ